MIWIRYNNWLGKRYVAVTYNKWLDISYYPTNDITKIKINWFYLGNLQTKWKTESLLH